MSSIDLADMGNLETVLNKMKIESPESTIYVSTSAGWHSGLIEKVSKNLLVLKEDSGKIDLKTQLAKLNFQYIDLGSVKSISTKAYQF